MTRVCGAILLCVSVVVSGCYTAGVRSTAASETRRHGDTGVIWFWGIGNSITRASECPHGLAEARVYFPWYTTLVQTLTIGIMTPVKKTYTCARP